jgi:hypothetical protein
MGREKGFFSEKSLSLCPKRKQEEIKERIFIYRTVGRTWNIVQC